MTPKTIFMLLGTILFLQSFSAAPFKDKDSALKPLVERLKLLRFAVTEYARIEIDTLNKYKAVMEKVIVDPKVLEITTDKMQSILDEMRSFLEEYSKFDKSHKRWPQRLRQLVYKCDEIISQYAKEDDHEDIPEAETLVRSFKENGYDNSGAYDEANIKPLTDNIYAEIKKYVDNLSETEKKSDHIILKLVKQFEDEPNFTKRDHIIGDFFYLIKLEDFLW